MSGRYEPSPEGGIPAPHGTLGDGLVAQRAEPLEVLSLGEESSASALPPPWYVHTPQQRHLRLQDWRRAAQFMANARASLAHGPGAAPVGRASGNLGPMGAGARGTQVPLPGAPRGEGPPPGTLPPEASPVWDTPEIGQLPHIDDADWVPKPGMGLQESAPLPAPAPQERWTPDPPTGPIYRIPEYGMPGWPGGPPNDSPFKSRVGEPDPLSMPGVRQMWDRPPVGLGSGATDPFEEAGLRPRRRVGETQFEHNQRNRAWIDGRRGVPDHAAWGRQ